MYCKFCGKEIEDATFCPFCGKEQTENEERQSNESVPPYGTTPPRAAEHDAPSGGFAVLGFFFPLVGLILYLVWKDSLPLRARSCGKGALIGVIVVVVCWILYVIVFSLLLSSLASSVAGAAAVL